jgi:4-amino-4-deoxy-L-arabinose transferase-like glycosyltransferase
LIPVLLLGFGIRLAYLLSSHPFMDEFTTVLAAREILRHGWPVLPSGLFYEHGLLFSYLDAPFVALGLALRSLLTDDPLFLAARLPSLVVGVVTIAVIYQVGRRWLSPGAGLLAALLLAVSPEGMVWAGRARMYALAQLLTLLLAYFVYHGSVGHGSARHRWLALLVLALAMLNQFGTLILIPPLLAAGLLLALLSRPAGQRPWFWHSRVLPFVAAFAALMVGAVLFKRLGQPMGTAPLGSDGAEGLIAALWETISYQAGLALNPADAIRYLGRQFGVPHHLWLSLVVVVGGVASLVHWRHRPTKYLQTARGQAEDAATPAFINLYLWLIVVLPVLEMITLLEPWRRNPRYLVMALPWFYLLVAAGALQVWRLAPSVRAAACATPFIRRLCSGALIAFLLLMVGAHGWAVWRDGKVAYVTPEPAYDLAFRYVAQNQGAADALLTMNTSGAALYFDQVDYFAVQQDADQFLLGTPDGKVDRWLGAPWVGTAADLNRVLNDTPTAWFVVDTIRLPVYYRGDWLALLETQMELVWAQDEALVYRTREDRLPLPTQPTTLLDARLGETITLLGLAELEGSTIDVESPLQVTLFWETAAALDMDYTVFLHVRDAAGTTVAQHDSQPLQGAYPTSRWLPGEMVIDPHAITLPADLPPGEYHVMAGLYRLDTLERLPLADDASGENAINLGSFILQ